MNGYKTQEAAKYVLFMAVLIGLAFAAVIYLTNPENINAVMYLPR